MGHHVDLCLSVQALPSPDAHPDAQACRPTSSGQLDKLLLPLQAGGGEGGQSAAHGCASGQHVVGRKAAGSRGQSEREEAADRGG